MDKLKQEVLKLGVESVQEFIKNIDDKDSKFEAKAVFTDNTILINVETGETEIVTELILNVAVVIEQDKHIIFATTVTFNESDPIDKIKEDIIKAFPTKEAILEQKAHHQAQMMQQQLMQEQMRNHMPEDDDKKNIVV